MIQSMLLFKVTIPLITHFAVTDNKVAANKYKKANGQMLYNQGINRFQRAIFVKNMHSYIKKFLEKALTIDNSKILNLELIFYLPKNYQYIKRLRGEIILPKKEDVEVGFDVDNISNIWKKTIQDSLTMSNVISDDTAWIIRKTSEEVIFISPSEQMKIEILIHEYERKI